MARSGDWELSNMAEGDPKPAWPLQGVTPKFSVTSFGGGRPFGCTDDCGRWHAGIDLSNAKGGTIVLAPEGGVVVAVDQGWSEGSKALYLRSPGGLFMTLGGFQAGSHKEYGIVKGANVKKGQPLGRILGAYGMLHFETYADPGASRSANTQWPSSQKPPA